MHMQERALAFGEGWRADDIVCSAGPRDRPYEEMHSDVCVALVRGGTFQYRTRQGNAVLGPGSILLGNQGVCFCCGHEHSRGDRCLSFHFSADLVDEVAGATPGVRRMDFTAAALPPLPELAGLTASLQAAEMDDEGAWEELVLQLIAKVLAIHAGLARRVSAARPADARRISEALHYIETNAEGRISLARLAREAGMSRFHFLRIFRQVVGVTPHQHVLHTRMQRAAVRLRCTDEPISAIAFDAGFEDLSTFNRRFRRVMGTTPRAFRLSREATPTAPSLRPWSGAT